MLRSYTARWASLLRYSDDAASGSLLRTAESRFQDVEMNKSAPDAKEREPLSGLVERVTVHSADTGFCVLRVKVRGKRDLVNLLGRAAEIHAGEHVQASGHWEQHREHGPQFRALFLQVTPPSSREGVWRDGLRRHRKHAATPPRSGRHWSGSA
jgi:hypothetical protein